MISKAEHRITSLFKVSLILLAIAGIGYLVWDSYQFEISASLCAFGQDHTGSPLMYCEPTEVTDGILP